MAAVLQRPAQPSTGGILLNTSRNVFNHNYQWQSNGAMIPSVPSSQSVSSSSSSSSSSRAATPTVAGSGSLSESSQGKNKLDTRRSSTSPSSRRIRFAPLPDPRRSVLVTDDGEELPFPLEKDDASISCAGMDLSTQSLTAEPDAVSQTASVPASSSPFLYGVTPASPAESDATHAQKRSSSVKNLLRPFRSKRPSTAPSNPPSAFGGYDADPSSQNVFAASSSSSRASSVCSSNSPMSSGLNISTEEILTLGTINIFRSSSRSSNSTQTRRPSSAKDSSSSTWGLPLNRWTSSVSSKTINSAQSAGEFGSPLARSQSSQSWKGDVRGRSMSNPAPTNKVRKGTRMLNGNVYGGRKGGQNSSVNPFANARDEVEPEFVEWGHGGMGAVNGGMGSVPNGGGKFGANKAAAAAAAARSSGGDEISARWAKLQTNGGIMVGSTEAAAKGGTADDDGDDGSGMGWVRKRREERERLRKEKEAAEKAEAEKPASSVVEEKESPSDAAPEVVVEDTATPTPTEAPVVSTPSAVEQHETPAPKDQDHVLTAVNVPAPVHKPHHHHRAASVAGSLAALGVPAASSTPINGSSTTLPTTNAELGPANAAVSSTAVDGQNTVAQEESDSDSEEEDDENNRESESDDEDEDEDALEQTRKTALGAGVEKISRHKE